MTARRRDGKGCPACGCRFAAHHARELQSRLDAIAAIVRRKCLPDAIDADVIAICEGKQRPKAALKRWLPAKGGKEGTR